MYQCWERYLFLEGTKFIMSYFLRSSAEGPQTKSREADVRSHSKYFAVVAITQLPTQEEGTILEVHAFSQK